MDLTIFDGKINIKGELSEENFKDLKKYEVEVSQIEWGKIYFKKTDYCDSSPFIKPLYIEEVNGYLMVRMLAKQDFNFQNSEWVEITKSLSDALHYYIKGRHVTDENEIIELQSLSDKLTNGELTAQDLNQLKNFKEDESEETAIMNKSSKEGLIEMKNSLDTYKNKLLAVQTLVDLKLAEKKRELDKIKNELYDVLTVYNKQIERINKVIVVIELYLGIEEEVVQIRTGNKAPKETPISFRQLVLYMDEEVGVADRGGLDFQDVDKFDEWLQDDRNLQQVLPETKGMVVFKPRRSNKHYSDTWSASNDAKNAANKSHTYLFIRNGEELYRIYTDKIVMNELSFPSRNEIQKIFERIESESNSYQKEKMKEQADDQFYVYKKQATLIQGLIDRTEIFHPLPAEKISVFNLQDNEKYIRFIYDGEDLLPTGRLSFQEWRKQINQSVSIGSRIILSSSTRYKDYPDRWLKYYAWESNYPEGPDVGLYAVEQGEIERQTYVPVKDYEKWLEKMGSDIRSPKLNLKKYSKEINIVEIKFQQNPENPKDLYRGHYIKTSTMNGKSVKWDEIKIECYDVSYIEKFPCIKYNPGGLVYSWDYRKGPTERKNRLTFKIFNDDSFILNYDQVELEDIEFYLHSRVDRPNYLSMIPTLKEMKKHRLAEIEKEKDFIQMVIGYMKSNHSLDFTNEEIEDKIQWWKLKNKWKRPIDKDDEKAFRMIVKKLKKEI